MAKKKLSKKKRRRRLIRRLVLLIILLAFVVTLAIFSPKIVKVIQLAQDAKELVMIVQQTHLWHQEQH